MPKSNVTEASTIFDGIVRKNSTIVFESDAVKKSFKDKDGKIPESIMKDHTLHVEFDFTGLTVEEAVSQLVSTTSFMKLFQNNIIGNTDSRWTEQEILDTVSKGVYKIKVRDLLDNKKSRALTPEQRAAKTVKECKKVGMTDDEILAAVKAQLNIK